MPTHRLFAVLVLALSAAGPLAAEAPQLEIEHKSPVLCLAWSGNGQLLATGTRDGTVKITEIATGKEVIRFASGDVVRGMAFSPDGKKLAVSQPVQTLSTWEVATGNQISFSSFKNNPADHVAFTSDGQTVMAVSVGQFLQWHLTGAVSSSNAKTTEAGFAAISPDGLVSGWADAKGQMRILQYKPNRPSTTLNLGEAHCLAFPIGGKIVAVGGAKDVDLWDWQAKKKTVTLTGLEKPAIKLSFAAQGSALAALAADGANIRVWDLTRNLTRRQIVPNRGEIGALALSPDGKLLAAACADNKALVFYVGTRELVRKGDPVALSAKELAALWNDLASADNPTADAAWHKLGSAGDQAVPFLVEQIRPIAAPPALDVAKIEKLAAELDAEKFATRERATKELIAAGEWAVVPLERVIQKNPASEAATRARLVIKKIGPPPLTPERRRVLEAVELLEQIRTKNAVTALEEIERTALVSQIRSEAGQALERLKLGGKEKK